MSSRKIEWAFNSVKLQCEELGLLSNESTLFTGMPFYDFGLVQFILSGMAQYLNAEELFDASGCLDRIATLPARNSLGVVIAESAKQYGRFLVASQPEAFTAQLESTNELFVKCIKGTAGLEHVHNLCGQWAQFVQQAFVSAIPPGKACDSPADTYRTLFLAGADHFSGAVRPGPLPATVEYHLGLLLNQAYAISRVINGEMSWESFAVSGAFQSPLDSSIGLNALINQGWRLGYYSLFPSPFICDLSAAAFIGRCDLGGAVRTMKSAAESLAGVVDQSATGEAA